MMAAATAVPTRRENVPVRERWNLVCLEYFLLCNSPLAQHTSRIINTHREVVGTATGRPD